VESSAPYAVSGQEAVSKTVVALNISFATNSDRIAAKYYAGLNKLGEALTRRPSTVEIVGHTDSIPPD
jgi:outer membrane protein OmpA-like peptidoglycan-associated protein